MNFEYDQEDEQGKTKFYAQLKIIRYSPPILKKNRREYRVDPNESNFSTNGEENVDSEASWEKKIINSIHNTHMKTMAKINASPKLDSIPHKTNYVRFC